MSYETDDKMVSHPDHYNSGKYEVIDIIEEFTKDLSGVEAVDTGNAIKYVLRWHKKNGVQDVKKAIWYLTHLAEHLEEKENPIKPHSVIIHKLADTGHYAIENAQEDDPKPKEYDGPDEHCRTCTHRFDTPENDKICTECYGREKYEPDEHLCHDCKHYDTSTDNEPCASCLIGKYDHPAWTRPTKWEPKDAPDTGENMDQEESDLSVPISKSSSGVYMPDSEPWKGKRDKNLASDSFNNAGTP